MENENGKWPNGKWDTSGMLTLALDTTTRAGSVAVTQGDVVLALVLGDATRTHGERLPGEIDEALRMAGVSASDLQLLVVASGPGAFTGLRIGLAAIQGMALVLDRPTIGVSALDALALHSYETGDAVTLATATWLDAQRGEVFAAVYQPATVAEDPHPYDGPIAARPDIVLARLGDAARSSMVFIGDGASRYREQIAAASSDPRIVPMPEAVAPALARLGQRRAARGKAGPPHALQPLYVRRPDAELERARRS
jgi:tRNA threonylcarbamoyladenosine biosynthesis protein TsaB